MEKLIKAKLKLKKVKDELEELDLEIDNIQDSIDELSGQKYSLEEQMELKEREENELLKFIRDYTINNIDKDISEKYSKDSFEGKLLKATLFTAKSGFKPAFNYVYVSKESIYSIDGYRALEYKHNNANIVKNMFVGADKLLEEKIDLSLFKEVDGEPETCGLDVARKVINKEIEKVDNDIFNIDKDYFMNEFLYKETDGKSYELFIFDFKNMKIAVNKEFIEDVFYIFKDSKFNVSYSGATNPIIFSNDEIKLLVLPVRYSDIDKI